MADEIATIISSLGLSNEAFLAIVLLAFVVIGAIIVIVASRPILDIYPYLQPNARVRARKGRLFDEKQISELVDANNVDDVTNYLRGSPDYAEHLDEYPLEKALDVQLGETYDMVARLAPSSVQSSFKVLAKQSDIDNIKSLLIAKEAGLDKEATEELLIPAGSLYEDISRLSDAETVTDVVAGLDGTEYAPVLEEVIPQYENTGMVLPFESALNKYYLEKLLKSTESPADENTQILYSYIGNQVDVANIKLILRAKADGLDYDAISPYMISNGYQLREWKLKDLMESQDVTGVISSLEGTKYADVLTELLPEYNETGSVAIFEKALDKFLVDSAKSASMKKPIGIGPIIGYLSQKEVEIRNLKVIARAKREADFPVSRLREMLV
ncbi:MAG: V-type ATP synthase subunit C [Methanobrevibacter sp.]|jgi:V/A-type H+-transporting ATPase subunit C|nr:V-type ATP synthase subunit C [Methanobrevibacter sp.]